MYGPNFDICVRLQLFLSLDSNGVAYLIQYCSPSGNIERILGSQVFIVVLATQMIPGHQLDFLMSKLILHLISKCELTVSSSLQRSTGGRRETK